MTYHSSYTRRRIYGIVAQGCVTSLDVAIDLGISVKAASMHLCGLARQKRIRFTGRHIPTGRPGRQAKVWEVVR